MTRFLLVRHAMTDANGVRLAGRTPGIHLNAEGRRQVAALAVRLSGVDIAAVHCSPLERTRETAAVLAGPRGLEVVPEEAFNEMDFGEWTGRTFEALARDDRFARFNAYRSGTPAPGGESMHQVQSRMLGGIERLRALHPGGCVAVVGHGDPLRALVAYHAGIPLDLLQRFEMSPGSVSILDVDASSSRLALLNGGAVEHLG